MTVLGLGLTIGLVVVTLLVLRILWVHSIKDYLTEVAVGVELLLDRGLWREVELAVTAAYHRLIHGKLKQCWELLVPVLTIPLLVALYFLSAIVFLMWVFIPFMLLMVLLP